MEVTWDLFNINLFKWNPYWANFARLWFSWHPHNYKWRLLVIHVCRCL